ncbi:MAG: LamG-like jellyroll fold domain-containing protein, partial [Chloroflexota bacterium]
LGTNPQDIDSDGDGISDKTEVEGFVMPSTGQQWYLNPNDYDTNRDGFFDAGECPALNDVDDGVFNGNNVSGLSCRDTDGDGTPDVFDYDNDDDQVPDRVDASPNSFNVLENSARSSLGVAFSGYTPGSTLNVEYQIRPDNDDLLWQINRSITWPTDREGQVILVNDREVSMTPMLAITIPDPSENPSNVVGSLPITPTQTIGDVDTSATIDTWLDTDTLNQYGINVTQSDTGELIAYVPLVPVRDAVGDSIVAWSASMAYQPAVANWGDPHSASLVWFISGTLSFCDTSDIQTEITVPFGDGTVTLPAPVTTERYNEWCSKNANYSSSGSESILHVYDDSFTVTGMNFSQFSEVKTAVVAENDALDGGYEDDLWRLSNGLSETFIQGRVYTDTTNALSRFDIVEAADRFDNDSSTYANGSDELWGIDKSALNTSLIEGHIDIVEAMDTLGKEQIPAILAETYGSSPNLDVDDIVTLLILREQASRDTLFGDSAAVSFANNVVSVDMSVPSETTVGNLQWAPYEYNGARWVPADAITYIAETLPDQLNAAISDGDINSILAAAVTPVPAEIRDGVVKLALSYYVGLYQGTTGILEVDGTLAVDPVNGDPIDFLTLDGDYNLAAIPAAVTLVSNAIELIQDIIDEEIFVDWGPRTVGTPVVGTLSPSDILAVFGDNDPAEEAADASFIDADTVGEGSKPAIKKAASALEKKFLKTKGFEEAKPKWAGKAKNGATALNVLSGVVGFVGPEAGLSPIATVSIQVSLTLTSETLAFAEAAGTIKKGLDASDAAYLQNLAAAKKAAKSGAVIGLIIDSTVIVGIAIYTILSENLEPGSVAFNQIVADAIGQLIVAIISAVIAAIFPVGTLIIAVVGLIDAIINAVCEIIKAVDDDAIDEGGDVDRFVCDGISGAIAAVITDLIYDNYQTVDFEADNRLSVALEQPDVNAPNGFVPGLTVDIQAVVTTTISLAPIEDGLIRRSFSRSALERKMRRSTFAYFLQTSRKDQHANLNFDQVNWGSDNQNVFFPSRTLTFNNAGINQTRRLIFTEAYNVVTVDCWGFIFTSNLTCDDEATRDSAHSELNKFVFDIFPNTIDQFSTLTWGRGLRSRSTVDWDQDGDGLANSWEADNGFRNNSVDFDQDGLSDYWEAVFQTNPLLSDSDGDGLLDGEEFPRTQEISPFVPDDSTWTGGWLITYDFDINGDPLETWVWADPNEADGDDDGQLDSFERTYNYNPNVVNTADPLTLKTAIETQSIQENVLGLNDSVIYTATVGNVDQFNTLTGDLFVEVPIGQVTASNPIATLLPDDEVTLGGIAPVGSVSASTYSSITVRAQVSLENGTTPTFGNVLLDIPLDDVIRTGVVQNFGSLTGDATCDPTINVGGCPQLGDLGAIGRSANYYSRWAKEISYSASGSNSELNVGAQTVSAWIKPLSLGGLSYVAGRDQVRLSRGGNRVQFELESAACDDSRSVIVSQARLNAGEWNHIVGSYDGSSMQVFVNGVPNQNPVPHTTGVCADNSPFKIGDANISNFRGLIDEVLLIEGGISNTEAEQLYRDQFYTIEKFQSYPIIIDATGPSSTLVRSLTSPSFVDEEPEGTYSRSQTDDVPKLPVMFALRVFDDLSTVSFVTVTVDSPSGAIDTVKAEQPSNVPSFRKGYWYFIFDPDVEGEYDLTITSEDAVGNVGTDFATVYVDDSPAQADLIAPTSIVRTVQDDPTDQNKVDLAGTLTDNRGFQFYLELDVVDWLGASVNGVKRLDARELSNVNFERTSGDWADEYIFPNRAYGEYSTLMTTFDLVGNVFTETIGTIEVDDYGPRADVNSPTEYITPTSAINQTGFISGTVSDINYPTSGRFFHLHLDEASGATEFVDATQDKLTVTCSGLSCPTAGGPGLYGSALDLDGSQLISVEANEAFTFTQGTLMGWFTPIGTPNGTQTLMAQEDGSTSNFRWQLSAEYDSMQLVTPSGTQAVSITITPEEWTHLAIVFDNGQWTGYVNGLPTERVTQTVGIEPDLPLNIGGPFGVTNNGFVGALDEVIVYANPLTLEQIYDTVNTLNTNVTRLEIQARHLNGAIWPEVDPDSLKIYIPFDDENGVNEFFHSSFITETVSCLEDQGQCPTAGVPGVLDSTAIEFDGNDVVRVNDSEGFEFEEVSVSFWVKLPPPVATFGTQRYTMVSKGNNAWSVFLFYNDDNGTGGRISFETPGLSAPNNVFGLLDETDIADGQWHHVVALYDGQFKRIYIDGAQRSVQEVTGELRENNAQLTIGNNFPGSIDEVAIFNRALTRDEITTLNTHDTWQDVTLDSPNSFYSTWTAEIPSGLEGLYTIGLRATDNLGNRLFNPEAWRGPIDLRGPRLQLDYISLPENNVQVTCTAFDLNITDEGWVCPVGDPVSELRVADDWFIDFFEPQTRTVSIQSDVVTINTTVDGSMTACDLHGNCRTDTVGKTNATEGIAVLEPVNGTVLTNF